MLRGAPCKGVVRLDGGAVCTAVAYHHTCNHSCHYRRHRYHYYYYYHYYHYHYHYDYYYYYYYCYYYYRTLGD